MSKKIITGIIVIYSAIGAYASLIQVSVTGTADTTEMGYTQGESYTFNWIVNDGYTGGIIGDIEEADTFDSTKNQWFSRLAEDPWLWASVSGDGLYGIYSRPSEFVEIFGYEWHDVCFDKLRADNSGLHCLAGNYYPSSNNIGLLVDGIEVYEIVANDLVVPDLDYSDTSFVNPATYLENYAGTYTSTSGEIYLEDKNSNSINFTVSSLTIGVVPEPSTVLLFCIGGIGAWILRRNKIKGELE